MGRENEDREFRVMPDSILERTQDSRTRIFLWGAASLLVGITLFAVFEAPFASRRTNLVLVWIAGTIVASTVLGAYAIAYQQVLRRLKRRLVFVLTENELVRRLSGWPDVRINLHRIRRLQENPRWLVVESSEPFTRIAVPTDLQAYAILKRELIKYCPEMWQQH